MSKHQQELKAVTNTGQITYWSNLGIIYHRNDDGTVVCMPVCSGGSKPERTERRSGPQKN